jgi:uncharacterized protein (DUF952 family)
MAVIYHLVKKADWEAARTTGQYRASSLHAEGFIHCCGDEAQMLAVANARFAGEEAVLVLDVDTDGLLSQVKYEASRSGSIYPHIYGPLDLDAVRRVRPLLTDSRGKFIGVEP